MLSNTNQEQEEYQDLPELKLIKNDTGFQKKEYFLYYNSGVFPILMVIIFFLCIGVIINIGLRIQNMNYDKKIYSINQLISSEKERTDRLNLKISELKSPSRIAEKIFPAGENTTNNINTTGGENKIEIGQASTKDAVLQGYKDFKKLDIVYSKTINDAVISSGAEDNIIKFTGVNFMSIVNNAKDILMVVSEGILTFFIP
jgi:cell division protein FtsL